ncbi:MAG: DUF1156 domain-containing protein, partial [Polyangiaceae bacterium]|nr:DUF1156 domain-containing protein [Polyangiaceae bacterium]
MRKTSMTPTVKIKSLKKLIEVALPLDAISAAAGREKSIRHGHPSTLHLWWARRPLAAARAVIFAQMVNDPGLQKGDGFEYGMSKADAQVERQRLFRLVEDLVKWENTNNEEVLAAAREEIRRSWREVCDLNKDHPDAAELFNPEVLPAFHDPFAGGGSLPLEAQRLGFESYASDLNPVAVLINKAMVDIPPRFAGRPPVGPIPEGDDQTEMRSDWSGTQGLAEDVRRYGAWMRVEAEKRIGHLYPKVEITAEMAMERPDLLHLVGQELTVIAWLWARTVRSPSPLHSSVHVPLVSSFVVSSKVGREAYVEPVIDGDSYRFSVRLGLPTDQAIRGTKAVGRGAHFRCVLSDAPISGKYIMSEGRAGRIGTRLMAMVADGPRGRVYIDPTALHEAISQQAQPNWKPDIEFNQQALGFRVGNYGITRWSDMFTQRQLAALTTFSDLVAEAIDKVKADFERQWAERTDHCVHECSSSVDISSFENAAEQRVFDLPLADGGSSATAYAQAVGVFLAFGIDKMADRNSRNCGWVNSTECMRNTFSRQVVPMVWDCAESCPIGDSGGGYSNAISQLTRVITQSLSTSAPGFAIQCDAQTQTVSANKLVSTDPPYYDNIGYADLSDFFYVWLRRSLRPVYPELFATLAVPKAEELVATPNRHGGKALSEKFFLDGMTKTLRNLARLTHPALPVTIYYAFKQSETTDDSGTSSTGWETFLEAVIKAGFSVTGTWPMRTELANRMRGVGSNALASSIVLVCRKRPENAPKTDQRHLIHEIASTLPNALDDMTHGTDHSPISPVDLSQAIIGPGMAIYSKYSTIMQSKNSTVSVKDALALINRFLAEEDFDHDTQFCLNWFTQYGLDAGPFGEADLLARAKSTSVDGVVKP